MLDLRLTFINGVYFGSLFALAIAYDWICPENLERKFRSVDVCNNDSLKYSCLCNTEETSEVKESCIRKPEYAPLGQKYVWTGGYRNVECNENKFQPFALYETNSSHCLFWKSRCDEEGQIVFKEGLKTADRSCRCDHTKGYSFMTKPKQKCYCNPLDEDCTCFRKECPDNHYLSSDYDCISVKSNDSHKCSDTEVTRDRIETETFNNDVSPILANRTSEERNIWTNWRHTAVVPVIVVSTVLGCLLVLCILLLLKYPEKNFEYAVQDDKCESAIEETNIKANRNHITDAAGVILSDYDKTSSIDSNTSLSECPCTHYNINETHVNVCNSAITSQPKDDIGDENESEKTSVIQLVQENQIALGSTALLSPTSELTHPIDIKLYGKIDNHQTETKTEQFIVITDITLLFIVCEQQYNPMVGSSCTLKLDVYTGKKLEKVEWLHFKGTSETVIDVNKNVEKYSGGTIGDLSLTINNINEDDNGEYKCRISNGVETATSTTISVFVCVPSITLTFNCKDKTILCEVNNLPDPTELHFLCKTADNIISKIDAERKSSNDPVIKCSLKVHKSGEYTFVAKNIHTTVSKGVYAHISTVTEQPVNVNTFGGRDLNDEQEVIDIPSSKNKVHENNSQQPEKLLSDASAKLKSETEPSDIPCSTDELRKLNPQQTEKMCLGESLTKTENIECDIGLEDMDLTQIGGGVQMIVSFDIGTTYTRYICLPIDCQTGKEKWDSAITMSMPTCLLLKASNELLPSGTVSTILHKRNATAIHYLLRDHIPSGDTALKDYVKSLQMKNNNQYMICDIVSFGANSVSDMAKAADHKDVLKFEKFKLEFYRQENITNDMVVDDVNGRKMKVIDVYSAVIQSLRLEVLTKIKEKYGNVEEEVVTWFVTVPDTWSRSAEEIVQRSCQKGGINLERLVLVSESRAAFEYYRCLQYDSIQPQLEGNAKCLVIDIGGGTCDITVHDACGNKRSAFIACRYSTVTVAIMNLLRNVIGDRALDTIEKEKPELYGKLKDTFCNFLITNMFQVPVEELNDVCYRFRLSSLEKIVEDFGKEEVKTPEFLSESNKVYARNMKLFGDKLIIKQDIIDSLIKKVTKHIVAEIEYILNKEEKIELNNFFIVGGFSSIPAAINDIETAFPEKHITTAKDKVFCIAKGATLCGINKK